MSENRKAMLVILDGWGHGQRPEASAVFQAHTPYMDSLYDEWPHAELVTYGEQVGLPAGQMGNSEVGHLNIGAGRIVYQALARINKAIADNSIADNPVVKAMIQRAKAENKPVHLMGLLSDGGVHSHIDHLIAFCKMMSSQNVKVYVHAFMDGRDTRPKSGKGYLKSMMMALEGTTARISTIIGRYYAMDRDNRWERIAKAYSLIVNGVGEQADNPLMAIQTQYDNDITDEFVEPIKIGDKGEGLINEDDIVFFANFRTDRPRQLTSVLTQKVQDPNMTPLSCHFVTLTQYDAAFQGINVIFNKEDIPDTLGDVVADKGLSQLRIAETEKYPHVSFFFSGGREALLEREKRIMINSPKVATYDLQPEMSAYEVTTKAVKSIKEDSPDLIILNYANADMVGHTGSMSAATKAVEVVDSCLESLVTNALLEKYNIVIIADHGNSDIMINEDGTAHTAHTTNMVPIIIIDESNKGTYSVTSGKLADVAPTILELMRLSKSTNMTGVSLISPNI